MNLSPAESLTLNQLERWGTSGITASQIAHTTGVSESGIRRTIQQLIRKGYAISYARDGIYRLGVS